MFGVPAFALPVSLLIYVPFTAYLHYSSSWFSSHLGRFWISYVMVIMFFGLVAYVVDALRSSRVPEAKRKLWVVLLIFGGFSVMPFYWWWYVRSGGR